MVEEGVVEGGQVLNYSLLLDVWPLLGVRVFVEPKALFHVVGTTMDFQYSGLIRIVFENPNAKGSREAVEAEWRKVRTGLEKALDVARCLVVQLLVPSEKCVERRSAQTSTCQTVTKQQTTTRQHSFFHRRSHGRRLVDLELVLVGALGFRDVLNLVVVGHASSWSRACSSSNLIA
ncbi:FeS cluster biogenesis [Phytophthora cactorum]|nr:FeS cluster biogenesis [Phytophthora cactorum]